MRVPLSWLREMCPTELRAEEVADVLTRQGVEVDRIVRPWAALSGVVAARVLEVADHPSADRLCLATVDAGGREHRVVVGVRNFAAGDLVPYAPARATLPGFHGPLEHREIRGQTSEGMLCSPKELGVSSDHSGILVLPPTLPPGADLVRSLGLDEPVLDIEVFPNRPDLLSVLGVAREMAAGTGADLLPPSTEVEEGLDKADDAATVEIADREGCPRYLARVIRGVRWVASPLPAQIRLAAAGMRPLSAAVDATNYVLLELGHPLHPFDLATLAGPGIVVRRARQEERLVTLNGVERTLAPDDLVIADTERAVALAGLMGGADTEVGDGTADVLLESAHFEPTGVARTARRLGLRSEASMRFERGADPEALGPAAARAAGLIAAWAGGTVAAGAIDVGEAPPGHTVSVRPARVRSLLGMELSTVEVREALGRLRLPATGEEADGTIDVGVPSYRVDLVREVDLIEEIGRATGYERVPSTLPGVRQAGGPTREQRIARRVRDVLAGAGFFETRSSSFAGPADVELFGDERVRGIRVANPVSGDDAYLRTSLLPALLRAGRRNVAHRRVAVRLFEVGTVFREGAEDPVEEERLAAVVTGPAAEGWPAERRPQEFLDAKGAVDHLMDALGLQVWSVAGPAPFPWHPGRSATVLLGGEPVGEVGEIHPRVAEAFDLPGGVAGFDLGLLPVIAGAVPEVAFRDISRFPPVRRDLAFVVGRDVPAGAIHAALVQAGGDLLDRAVLFDVFEGDPLPEERKSLAFAVDFRAMDRTLTDAEADEVVGAISERLGADFGAELRTG